MIKYTYTAPKTIIVEVSLKQCILDFSRNYDNNQKPNDNGEESF